MKLEGMLRIKKIDFYFKVQWSNIFIIKSLGINPFELKFKHLKGFH